ncbi:alpha/beta hydrolase [Fodinicurvata sediminis]|uniref:alpha/beta hydrolase n=1 Tax=Fodinicurvata sediminis TaxID=1121832 RepID=UPI0003B6D51A|nr:alpha/beta fold hydrolase [Fodinicurvata sediminis]
MSSVTPLDGPRSDPANGGSAEKLVILLHGLGADGNDLIALAPLFGQILPEAAFVAPNAPETCDMAPNGYQWFSLQEREPQSLHQGAEAARTSLDAFIDQELEKHGLEEKDLVVVGFSQGTMMALYTCLRRPNACAGIIGFSGLLIDNGRMEEETKSRPPVMLIHGEEDPVVPFECMAAAEKTLTACGVPVQTHARPELEHGIDQDGLVMAAGFLQVVYDKNPDDIAQDQQEG